MNMQDLCVVEQAHGKHCGTIALMHLGIAMGKWDTGDEAAARTWHRILLHAQQRRGGGNEHLELGVSCLAELLQNKGVPSGKALERARQAIKRIGLAQVQQALSQKDAWRAL